MHTYTKKELMALITGKLRRNFGRDVDEATSLHMFKACALVLRDIMSERQMQTQDRTTRSHARQVHYLSLEFLMGRSLMKNAYNLGVLEPLKEAIEGLGFSAPELFESEPDAGLGNGGLGRLAACYLDSMTTLDIPATGYSICYELGIFKQKIVDGQQVELPDNWLGLGDAWLIPKMDEVEEVRFGGRVEDVWDEHGHHSIRHTGYDSVLAVPKDMEIAGYGTEHGNVLRLWDSKSPQPVDMSLFSRGEYLKAVERQALAESISKILYPEDNHYEGKSLRLKQQYFFVSATIQSIVRKHRAEYGTLRNFHLKHVIQINDTHPTLVIPELMRILLDEEGYGWDEAWNIVTHTVAYTNHTVLAEALERWPQQLVIDLLPRIWQIIVEISNRYQAELTTYFHGDMSKVERMAIIWGGDVRMANLCICACFAVNGVSALHSDILKREVFHDAYLRTPGKFKNVTNGIDHRRWLSECNPQLDALIKECCGGDRYLLDPDALSGLEKYKDDSAVLERLDAIKQANKKAFASYVARESGIILNTDAVFDVQVKRLHEYKRQLLNVLHIIYEYQHLKEDPNFMIVPKVYLFGAKAAPGYYVAKRIIHLINSLAATINADPICKDKLQVVFLENYRVSLAEKLMPASELSEQISTAGKEASGTGNMKFMMNGAVTIGTLDGANVEMHQVLGDENIFLFGLKAHEVSELKAKGYHSYEYYMHNNDLRAVVDALAQGFQDGVSYNDLAKRLLFGDGCPADEYLLLADFDSYRNAQKKAADTYLDRKKWNQMSLMNVARSGIFAADRSIRDYARDIWDVPVRDLSKL
ncbi:glycogen/starch/alpha-glucan phosphorylase [Pseudoflavonifractor sp. DSM 107456]|uniref:Alpha-1,4 glucan phosphorylase n=2 Tax=Pseudoflavonifractor TaxID=1017280 RepID=A0ABR9RB32_9FIRM|nr:MULTISPECIES: glycogen/starch/alpha-glucan phosphorylase [Eubacteriales]MBC5730379.1 glycogen/starch/alpha-glucan phosphorylase [Pseudoflavonifractor hominis]MBE5055600.1 glycogen/starch/alpha-glucan phosphorylase [Pseudoflavonifractor gallinarum]MBS5135356.1 glycogen/starch/alpha-glucan phosphorylase [Oscillospiraceae bacterium]